MNKILVTGGAGFIGSHLVDSLIEKKFKVVIVDNLTSGDIRNVNKKANFYKVDICSSKARDIIFKEKPLVIFHLAAFTNVRDSIKNPQKDYRVNVLGSLNIIEAFLTVNRKRLDKAFFIFSSSGGAIYGDALHIPTSETYPPHPLSPYGINKLTVENYLDFYYKVYGLRYTALRYSNVYGPRQNTKGEAGVVAIFLDRLIHNRKPIIFGDGSQTRDFVYVGDVVKANLNALKFKKLGIFNIGTARETSIYSLFSLIKKITKIKSNPIYKPPFKGEVTRSCLDYRKARRLLGWSPKISLEKGIKITFEWYKSHKDN